MKKKNDDAESSTEEKEKEKKESSRKESSREIPEFTPVYSKENQHEKKNEYAAQAIQKKPARAKPELFFDSERKIKREIRILGIDDSPFSMTDRGNDIIVIGTIHRGGGYLEGIVSTHITVDGDNATERLVAMINNSKHKAQLQVIMTDGIAMGGFNVIDVDELSRKTRLPVIVIMRHKPNLENIKKAILNVENYQNKLEMIKKAGKIMECVVGDAKIYFQCKGIEPLKAMDIIKTSITYGNMPEPIRAAHIIASGIIEGESRGRA